ncbi:hypothetical protein JXM67_07185 [candidate division WOR-3 bacterium]|nr:hypothetical protein [candidate division WOR-3 bacterium]
MKRVFTLAVALLTMSVTCARTQDSPTVYSEFPGWRKLEKKAELFEYQSFPDYGLKMPDPEKWISTLTPLEKPEPDSGFVQVARKGNVLYVKTNEPYGGGAFIYRFSADTVENAYQYDSLGHLFCGEVGVIRFLSIFNNGLLRKSIQYMDEGIIWELRTVEYRPGSEKPKEILIFKTEDDAEKGNWFRKAVYDENGNLIDEASSGTDEY